jgi:hypothetical protein
MTLAERSTLRCASILPVAVTRLLRSVRSTFWTATCGAFFALDWTTLTTTSPTTTAAATATPIFVARLIAPSSSGSAA